MEFGADAEGLLRRGQSRIDAIARLRMSVGAAGSRQLHGMLQQRMPEVAVVVGRRGHVDKSYI